MDSTMFKKMKAKPGSSASVLYPPEGYPAGDPDLDFHTKSAKYDFVHLFVSSRQEFAERIAEALERRTDGGLLWISYPKAGGKNKPDINRDSMWDLSVSHGIHPVSQVALDETWSAMRFVDNKPGVDYARPGKKA